ncbi:MAG: carboxypeptidase-like regulatory domain-containing protein [Fidelibacterota bacterium]
MKTKLFLISLLGLLLASTAFAQTGKISGSVIDRETGEPLIGANVIVMGTSFGAATDVEGRFVILDVPSGTYSLKTTYVGYQEVTLSNVRVVAGLTVYAEDISLSSVAIEAEPIQVVAERPLIEKSATNAVRIVTSDEIEKLPVRGANEYFALQPGVVLQNDRIHIRGGRSDEVGFYIEGASAKDIVDRDGGSLINTIPEALEEVLVQAGGYAAEFGGANAGIIQQNFRTGGDRLFMSLQGETDNFGNYPGEKVLGSYSYGYSDYVVTLSGPLLFNRVRFFLAGENNFMRDYNPVFWSGSPATWFDGTPLDTVYDTGVRGGDKGDMEVLSWNAGNIPGRMRNRYGANGTLLLDFHPLRIKTAGAYTWQRQRSNTLPIMYLFAQDRLPLTDRSEVLINTKASYFLTSTSFLELNLNFLDRRTKTYDPWFKDDFLAYSDSLEAARVSEENDLGWAAQPSYTSRVRPYDFHGFQFHRPGYLLSGLTKDQRGYLGGSVAFTSQVGRHELKLGGSAENWSVRHYFVSGGRAGAQALLSFMRSNPDSARDATSLARIVRVQTTPNIYGFDEFGNVIDKGPDGPRHPKFYSAYLQDKIEYNDIIINAGLRYDYIFMDTWKLADPTRPEVDTRIYTLENVGKSQAYEYVSPRLGFAFPVTDRTVFHVQYGKFVQPPGLDVTYRGLMYSAFVFTGGYYFTNPVGYDLEPERTTQYEVGFTQQFTDFASFDLTAFYKDIRGQIQFDHVETAAGWEISQYPVYVNQDFATTKGLELSFRMRRTNRLLGQINYTFSDARGTNSFASSAGGALEGPGRVAPKIVIPLRYQQTHRGSVNLDYRFGLGDGGPILERSGINLLFTFNSGHPFTRAVSPGGLGQEDAMTGGILNDGDSRQRQPIEPINSSTTPWNSNLDVRLDKTFSLAGLDLNAYVYVQNVFNTRNVTNVYYGTGNAYDDGFLTSGDGLDVIESRGEEFGDLYRAANLENRQHNWWLNGFDLFDSPRQVRFGLRLEL